MRVPEYLAEQRVCFETLLHAPAFSAQQRAKVLHVPGRQVAKSVLLAAPEGFFLAVLPPTHQMDSSRLERELGGQVRLAKDREIARVFRDCEWGVVLPFGSLYGLTTLLDDALNPDDMLIFEGNTHVEAV